MKLASSILVQQSRIGVVHDNTVVAKPLLAQDHIVRRDVGRMEVRRLQPAIETKVTPPHVIDRQCFLRAPYYFMRYGIVR